MTPTREAVVVALFSGAVGAVLAFLATLLRNRHERTADIRQKLLDKGSEFAEQLQKAFGPVLSAIDARADEPDADEADVALLDDEEDDYEDDPTVLWSPEMTQSYNAAKNAFLRAESALSPLLLLLPEESVAVRSAQEAISTLGSAVGALEEPDDETTWSRLFVLHAQLSLVAFNRAMRHEIKRAGRRVAPWTRGRESRRHKAWLLEETNKRTHDDPERGVRVLAS